MSQPSDFKLRHERDELRNSTERVTELATQKHRALTCKKGESGLPEERDVATQHTTQKRQLSVLRF